MDFECRYLPVRNDKVNTIIDVVIEIVQFNFSIVDTINKDAIIQTAKTSGVQSPVAQQRNLKLVP